RADLRAAGQQRRSGVRVRQADGDGVEALVLVVAVALGGGDLQGARLEADDGRGHGDAVLLGEVVDRPDVRVVGQQVAGDRTQRGDALDVVALVGAVPQAEHRRGAGGDHVQGAGQQRLVHGGGAGDLLPLHVDVEAFGL